MICDSLLAQDAISSFRGALFIIPSDGVDRDSGGELGHLLKMSLLALGSFKAGVPIHLQCPDPPRLTVIHFGSLEIKVDHP